MDRKIIQLELVRRIRFWEEEIAEWQTKIFDFDIDTDDIADDIRVGVSAERLDKYVAQCREIAKRHKCSVLAFHWALQDYLAGAGKGSDFDSLV